MCVRACTHCVVLGVRPRWLWWRGGRWPLVAVQWTQWWSEWNSFLQHENMPTGFMLKKVPWLFKKIYINALSALSANYFSLLLHNNTSLVQLQIITGFCPAAAFELRGNKGGRDLLFWWPDRGYDSGYWREWVPDCPKGLTAIVYCSTRQDLAPICAGVRAQGGRLHRAPSPALRMAARVSK